MTSEKGILRTCLEDGIKDVLEAMSWQITNAPAVEATQVCRANNIPDSFRNLKSTFARDSPPTAGPPRRLSLLVILSLLLGLVMLVI